MKKRADGRFVRTVTINGKRKMFYSSEPTEKKAERDIMRQMVEFEAKQQEKAKGKTFQEVADEWEEEHYKHLQWQTEHRYKSLVAHLNERFKDCYIREITTKEIELFFLNYAKMYSNKSTKDQMNVAKMIFKYAMINEYIDKNPIEYLSAPKGIPGKSRKALTDEEISIIESNILREFGLLAYFLLYTGMRKGEALALTYGDIDFQNNIIRINKSIEHRGNKPYLKQPKTEAGNREIPLLKNVKSILSNNHKKNEIIFSQNGQYMSKSYFDDNWKRYCESLGICITAHQLRHTFATLLFEWGIDVKDCQNLLGHTDITTTRNIYTHVRKNRMQATADKINNAISSCSQPVVNIHKNA